MKTEKKISHPTYGTIDDLLQEIRANITQGYVLRAGLLSALNWFSVEHGASNAAASPPPPNDSAPDADRQ
jgi:hypothetical protein